MNSDSFEILWPAELASVANDSVSATVRPVEEQISHDAQPLGSDLDLFMVPGIIIVAGICAAIALEKNAKHTAEARVKRQAYDD